MTTPNPTLPTSELQRRRGRFFINREAVLDSPEETMQALRDFLIVRAELRYDIDAFEYTAISPWFDVLPVGLMAPLYDLTFTKDEHGSRVADATLARP